MTTGYTNTACTCTHLLHRLTFMFSKTAFGMNLVKPTSFLNVIEKKRWNWWKLIPWRVMDEQQNQHNFEDNSITSVASSLTKIHNVNMSFCSSVIISKKKSEKWIVYAKIISHADKTKFLLKRTYEVTNLIRSKLPIMIFFLVIYMKKLYINEKIVCIFQVTQMQYCNTSAKL